MTKNKNRDANALHQHLEQFPSPDADVTNDAGDWALGKNGNRCIAQRYVEANIGVHLHVSSRRTLENGKFGDFCLSFNRAVVLGNLDEAPCHLRRVESDKAFVRVGACEMQRLVTVDACQFIEVPERIVVRRSVQTLERLLPLNECQFRLSHSADFASGITGETACPGVSGRWGTRFFD
jgi:hypothetical protein